MSISQTRFLSEIDEVFEDIVDSFSRVQQENSISFEELLDGSCYLKLRGIEDFLKNQKLNKNNGIAKKVLNKYVNGTSCFGVMQTSQDSYFSLSSKDDYSGMIWNGILSTSHDISTLADMINNFVFEGKYVWATLSDETRRYTEPVYDNNNISLIKSSCNLGGDRSLIFDEDVVGKTYACCERKMQSKNGHDFDSDKIFYARWAPCEKCIPALAEEKGDIKIYAIANNYRAWKRDEKRADRDIQEYTIKPSLKRIR
jgi:hypothetical protein